MGLLESLVLQALFLMLPHGYVEVNSHCFPQERVESNNVIS